MHRTNRLILAALVAGAALAGGWWGRAAWRAHRKLVTLHVRNAALADVVRSMERQTWERIRFDKHLEARITLNLVDAPLSAALDAVALKAGARWQINDAVGASTLGWRQLEMALDTGSDVDDAGWTNLAPAVADAAPPDAEPAKARVMLPPPDGAASAGQKDPGASPPRNVQRSGPITRHALAPEGMNPGGERIITMSDGKVDQWSPERLVLESRLTAELGASSPEEATLAAARQTAAAVHGEARVYYALEKAPFGVGVGGGFVFTHRTPDGRGGPRHLIGPGASPGPSGDFIASMRARQQEQRLRELANSPEEQVQNARERAATGGKMFFQKVGVKN